MRIKRNRNLEDKGTVQVMTMQKKWNKNFKQDAYTELMQIYSIFKINEFKQISFMEFSNKYFNEYLHEDWENNEKRTFINNLLNHFPKIVPSHVHQNMQIKF